MTDEEIKDDIIDRLWDVELMLERFGEVMEKSHHQEINNKLYRIKELLSEIDTFTDIYEEE